MKKKWMFEKLILNIEKIGNKLPHPFWIFVNLSISIVILSFFLSKYSTQYPAHGINMDFSVRNLFQVHYLLSLIKDIPTTFANFKPLPIVILTYMGISVMQETGTISALIRATLRKTPTKYLTAVIALIGINSNIVSDAGVIIIPAISGALFQSLGLNPWIGIIIGYASADGGFTLNMLVAGTDVIISGITSSVTESLYEYSNIHPFNNWYFMIAGTILVVFLTVWVTEKYTKKRLEPMENYIGTLTVKEVNSLSKREKIGLKYFIYGNIICFAAFFAFWKYYNNNYSLSLSSLSFFGDYIVVLIFFYLVITSVMFGLKAGTMKGLGDLPSLFNSGIVGSKSFIVTALPASIFVKIFNDSNIGFWAASIIANSLKSFSLSSLVLLVLFVIMVAILNLFITSGSVKWLFIAPLAIPIFTNLGFSPSMVQLSYRIGDTCTNIIAPTEYYLPIIISLFESYKPDKNTKVGIGTVISLAMPYTLAYMIGLIILLIIWNIIGLPIGF